MLRLFAIDGSWFATFPTFKETSLAQTRGKTTQAKQPAPKTKPVKEALTKAALVNLIAEENGVTRDVAKGVLATIETAMMGSIHPRGVGEFTLPGLFKVSLRKVPARKAGTLVRNPSTGEMVKSAAKPASMRVKIRALSKLKTATVA
ncbi:MAG TPA: HU family DNA-binding protein [Frankiaceae bacterium]|nr:HU family DNA-binding protein [Frankiaceae bacterium]